jgi:uncharacterized protein (DUF2164 family)
MGNECERTSLDAIGSDIFLSWCADKLGRHFYIRQLRDIKLKPKSEVFNAHYGPVRRILNTFD